MGSLEVKYNGKSIVNDIGCTQLPDATYNGKTILSQFEGEHTFKCSGQKMRTDLGIGTRTLKCAGQKMRSDVVAKYTKSGDIQPIPDSGKLQYGGFVDCGAGRIGDRAVFHNGNYRMFQQRWNWWDAYDQNLTHTCWSGSQEVSDRDNTICTMNPGNSMIEDIGRNISYSNYPGQDKTLKRIDQNLTKTTTTFYFSWGGTWCCCGGTSTVCIRLNSGIVAIMGGSSYNEDEGQYHTCGHKWIFNEQGSMWTAEETNKHMYNDCDAESACTNGTYAFVCWPYRSDGKLFRYDCNLTRMTMPTDNVVFYKYGDPMFVNNNHLIIFVEGRREAWLDPEYIEYRWNVNGTYEGKIERSEEILPRIGYSPLRVCYAPNSYFGDMAPNGDLLSPCGEISTSSSGWINRMSDQVIHISQDCTLSFQTDFKETRAFTQMASNGKQLIAAGGAHYWNDGGGIYSPYHFALDSVYAYTYT